jgi:predicted RNase H-like nuclease (RuvC/YqgF family)
VIEVSGTLSAEVALSARAKARPGPPDATASNTDRIARLERYVDNLDQDLDQLRDTIDRKAAEVTEAAREREQELRREMDRRDDERRQALRPSLRRQAIGAVCVFVGVLLGALGDVL